MHGDQFRELESRYWSSDSWAFSWGEMICYPNLWICEQNRMVSGKKSISSCPSTLVQGQDGTDRTSTRKRPKRHAQLVLCLLIKWAYCLSRGDRCSKVILPLQIPCAVSQPSPWRFSPLPSPLLIPQSGFPFLVWLSQDRFFLLLPRQP